MIVEKHSRLPRKYSPEANPPAERRELNAVNLPKLHAEDPLVILQRYLSDESTQTIAASYGVTRQALGQFLLKHVEEDWKEAQVARAIARKEKAEDSLEDAKDPLALARARELLKAAQWDLERVCRRIYGEDRVQAMVLAPILNITVSQPELAKQLPAALLSVAHARDVQVQQYDSRAPQQEGNNPGRGC